MHKSRQVDSLRSSARSIYEMGDAPDIFAGAAAQVPLSCPPGRKVNGMYADLRLRRPGARRAQTAMMDEFLLKPGDIRGGDESGELFRIEQRGKTDPSDWLERWVGTFLK